MTGFKLVPLLLLAMTAISFAATTHLDESTVPQEADQASFGRHLVRTVASLEASENTANPPVRILFYGQSIVDQAHLQSTFLAEVKQRFPKANIVSANHAIGGYEAPALVKTMVHDVVPFHPDLIVFDDYGGETDGNYELILSYMRTRTTAEILMWSPHVDNFNAGMDKQRDVTAKFRHDMADKYGCEFADVRTVWQAYLEQTKTPKTALLRDQIHNTDTGCELLATIIARHVVKYAGDVPADHSVLPIAMNDEAAWKAAGATITGDWKKTADGQGIELAPGASLELSFNGTRVDLFGPAESPAASAKIMVDDQSPSSIQSTWVASRPTVAPIGWFPALNQVTLGEKKLERENWTLHFYDASPDGTAYHFRLTGSVTGPDGEGANTADFVSNSGRIRFSVADITIAKSAKYTKKPMPAEFDVTWKTFPLSVDEYTRKPGDTKSGAQFQTILDGLPNQSHRLRIVARNDGPVAIERLVVHQPMAAIEAGTK